MVRPWSCQVIYYINTPALGIRYQLFDRVNGNFQIIEKINDNAYKVDLSNKYGVSATFNVSDLSLFDVGDDSKSNSFEEIGDDVIQPTLKDPLGVPVGSITRAITKKFKEAFNGLLQDTWAKMDYKITVTQEEQALIKLIHIQYGIEDYGFWPRE